jgi:competence protein ComEC
VLRAHTPVGRVLLPGDAELASQSSLLGAGADLHAEILKVPHHGSRSSLPAFLTASRSSLALVSAGRGNTYGHPNPQVVGLLARSGALVRRTDESGDLAVVGGADPRGAPSVVARGDPRPDPRRR